MSAENQNDAPSGPAKALSVEIGTFAISEAWSQRETCALCRYWAHRGYTAPDVPRETTG
jgi:hypothetical protein